MMRSRMQGFTLPELMTVLVIIGVLCSIGGFFVIDHIKKAQLIATTRIVFADIWLARWTARSTSAVCSIQFNTDDRSYTINGSRVKKISDSIRFGIDPSVTGKPGNPRNPPPVDGITFSKKNTARFYPTGTVAPTGSVFLTDGKQTFAITVAITGRPKMWKSLGGSKWTAVR